MSAPETPAAPLIARADLFGDPVRAGGQLSPRGDRVAFLAPRDGVLNLWVLSVDAMDEARPVTDDRQRGVRGFAWAADSTTLLFLKDEQGDGNLRLFAVDALAAAPPRALTPAGVSAEILGVSGADPTGVVITLTARETGRPQVLRIDIASGERRVLEANAAARGFTRFVLDRENNVRLGLRPRADGGLDIMSRSAGGAWSTLLSVPFEDAMTVTPLAFEADGRSFLMLDTTDEDRDRTALVRVDAATGEIAVLGESERADVVDVWLDPATNAPEAFATEYLRREWRAIETEAQDDLAFLDARLTGDFHVTSRSADDARWIVLEESPTVAARSYLYDRTDRAGRRLTSLFRHRPALEQAPLQPMTPVEIQARDGLTLVAYLTLPVGADANADARPEQPAPLVILPHDGPWMRESYGFNAMHQWLANRGYAALSVNYRGSAGFGKAFLNAGNAAWGRAVREDLVDATAWAIASGIAQPERVAIVGSGYGGTLALTAAAYSPDQFRCAASYGGRANLAAWVEQAPVAGRDMLYQRVGDPRTAAGRTALREASSIYRANRISTPMLLALGGRDPRASRAETDQFAQARRARAGLTYLVFPDEGRDLVRSQNRLSYLAVLEHFLGDCLGGRIEPVGASFEGASINVYDGAVNVPGLSAFARRSTATPLSAPAPQDPAARALGDAAAAHEEAISNDAP
ncbi:MAG: prolyl oligopeptidase family serine peptidase [Hyphomonadaceae bacterium]